MTLQFHTHTHTHTHTTHTHYEWSVQDQYIFIHDAILESVTCGDTQIEASNLRVAMRKLNEVPHNSTVLCKSCEYFPTHAETRKAQFTISLI